VASCGGSLSPRLHVAPRRSGRWPLLAGGSTRTRLSAPRGVHGLRDRPIGLPSGRWSGQAGPEEARFRRGAGGTRAVETAASPTAAKRTMAPHQAGRVSRQGVVPTAEHRPQTAPNQGLELTAYSVRFAPAFSRSSGPALDLTHQRRTRKMCRGD
jgi:hypothetical protein